MNWKTINNSKTKYCCFVYTRDITEFFYNNLREKPSLLYNLLSNFSLFYLLLFQTSFVTSSSVQYPLQPLLLRNLNRKKDRGTARDVWVVFRDRLSGVQRRHDVNNLGRWQKAQESCMHQHQVYLHTDTSTEGAKMLTMFTFQSNTHHQFEAAAHQITLTAKERKRRLCELAADKRNTLKDPEQLHA